jgi:hypothetical protein
MRRPTLSGPFAAPHKTLQFWIFIALVSVALSWAPLILRFLRAPAALLPIHVWIRSAAFTLPIMMVVAWLGFRFGRVAWVVIGIGFLVLGLYLRGHL